MTIDECATWIAQTGDSESWRQWENGKCAIPDCVVEQLLAMRQQRKKHLHAIIEKINNRIGNNTMRFFPDLTAFQQVYPDGNFIDWKIYQSVAAELYAHDLDGFVNFSTKRNCRCYNNNERILTQHRYTF
ncbi:YdiL protein [Escherichia coli]|nr:YdiL protein [Escherichia coli]